MCLDIDYLLVMNLDIRSRWLVIHLAAGDQPVVVGDSKLLRLLVILAQRKNSQNVIYLYIYTYVYTYINRYKHIQAVYHYEQ